MTRGRPCLVFGGLRCEHLVQLLGDPYERGPAAELLQLGRPDVCTRGADSPQDVLQRLLHVASVFNLNGLTLRGSATNTNQCDSVGK